MIKANAHKYSVSAMCRVLQVNRSTYYYEAKQTPDDSELSSEITEIFKASRNNYGTRKRKKELMKTGKQVSRRRIGRIMKQEGLVRLRLARLLPRSAHITYTKMSDSFIS